MRRPLGVHWRSFFTAALLAFFGLPLAGEADLAHEYRQFMPAPSPVDKTVRLIPATGNEDGRIHLLIQNLESSRPVKGEFETTEEYQRRVKGARQAEISPGIRITDRLAFPFKIFPATFRYDADSEMFSVPTSPSGFSRDFSSWILLTRGGNDISRWWQSFAFCRVGRGHRGIHIFGRKCLRRTEGNLSQANSKIRCQVNQRRPQRPPTNR